jgi:hypothetical protein
VDLLSWRAAGHADDLLARLQSSVRPIYAIANRG